MTVPRKSAPWALLIGLAAVLLLAISGCAGDRAPSGARELAPSDAAVSAPAPMSPPKERLQRDIVTTGSLNIAVADVGVAVDRLVGLTTGFGGRVDDRTERTTSGHGRTAELTLRIPSPKVDEFLDDAKQLGDVSSIALKHDDVTGQRVDLDARVAALQASVDRLTALMKSASTTADLLQAETELTSRQADLDSLRAQRTQLGDQISYATLTVSLASEFESTSPGFVASVRHGWHALLSFTQGLIAVAGFLLPWLPVIAVIAGVFVVLRRRTRRRQ
ncbi:DUF4349 domain-containing protein [Mycolicibacter longobardus]|uniref:DUF4349 domain-containing protein n=1 Tax=Mycolicibacter longobardus TaxID=1108812 RepID=A0A1X1YDQ6_9MYCO|nr:DUF4349 domain-containing protein [Mycolicibacter longobardus]MCV7382489.1 DUF4349 domain-containing protein [Mycolicibacter longobardus]ORW09150.1 hypothetical protein AWC16_17370 [Mycolicibacter longobardus]